MSKSPYSQSVIDVGSLVLQFARTNRLTLHEDGVRQESDTDHTVMLSITACALAEQLYKGFLDIGKIAQFSIVHDLVEVHCGDISSFGITEEERKEKEHLEHESLKKIKTDYDAVFPWIGNTIVEYESLQSKEARFVKTVDKLMSKVTSILNHGAYYKLQGISKEVVLQNYTNLYKQASTTYGKEFPEVLNIMDDLLSKIITATYA